MTSAGNDRFAAGKTTTFRVVSGHRDALSTDCPGALIYPELDAIAAAAQATGTPKIVDASATPPGLGTTTPASSQPIVFKARVLGGASWVLTVLDARGLPVASGSGSGGDIAWTWNGARSDGTPLAAGTKLAYRIEAKDAAGANARLAARLARALPVVAEAPAASLAPAVISPDGDGADDVLAIGYTLARTGGGDAGRARARRHDGRDARGRRAAPGRQPERSLGWRGAGGDRRRRHLRRAPAHRGCHRARSPSAPAR